MENDEKNLSPEESLRVIRQTIDLAKLSIRENGFHFLLWGVLVVAACLTQYYLQTVLRAANPYWPWGVMPLLGVPAALIYEWRRDRRQPRTAANVVRDWYGWLWFGFGISLILGLFVTVPAGMSPVPFVLVLTGMATFMSGILLQFRPLIFGAAVLWAGALACLWLAPPEHALVQATATAIGYLVPGVWLNRQARRRTWSVRPA